MGIAFPALQDPKQHIDNVGNLLGFWLKFCRDSLQSLKAFEALLKLF